MLTKPGFVIRIRGKNKEEVDVEFPDKVETMKNMLPQLKIGDYVIANDGIIIEILTEKEAAKKLQHNY